MKNIPFKAYVWAVIALALVAGALVLIGVLRHEEAGLMAVCWNRGDLAVYVDTGDRQHATTDCVTSVEPLRWIRPHPPIYVRATCYAEGPDCSVADATRALTTAVETFNVQVGFELFDTAERAGNPDVYVSFGHPVEQWRAAGVRSGYGSTSHFRDARGRMHAVVELATGAYGPDVTYRALVHELGHVAGLAHDDFEGSVMFPTTRTADGPSMPFTRISDADRRLLRDLYQPAR